MKTEEDIVIMTTLQAQVQVYYTRNLWYRQIIINFKLDFHLLKFGLCWGLIPLRTFDAFYTFS